jgi:hypothetical protein
MSWPPYGKGLSLSLSAPVDIPSRRVLAGEYRVHTFYGRTEPARVAPVVFSEAYLFPADGSMPLRLSLDELRDLLSALARRRC